MTLGRAARADPGRVGAVVGTKVGDQSMTWTKPVVLEVCTGMEVTSYESAEIDPLH